VTGIRGDPADTLMLWTLGDAALRRRQISESESDATRKQMELRRLGALIAYCEAPRCRRQTLLAYFGDASDPCGHCDLCLDPPELIDGAVLAQKAMSAIARTGQRFGLEHLVNVLRGGDTDKVREHGHDALPTFGVGKDLTRPQWMGVFRQLFAAGLIDQPVDGHGEWVITPQGREVLFGRLPVALRPPQAERKAASRRGPAPEAADVLNTDDARKLYGALRAKRLELAQAAGKPAYTVFADRTLVELAQARPATLDAMAGVFGVGSRKLERYGAAFLEVIAAHR